MNVSWISTSHPPALGEEVHAWVWKTPVKTDQDTESVAILSPEERNRMMRFRFAADGRRYLTCHANLRRLLAGYEGCLPQELSFTFNDFGKPRLRGQRGEKPLYFNLSHSKDIGLLAVTRVGELGADIEIVRPIEPDVAEEHFSRTEMEELETLKGEAWLEGFYRCWTRKEAILKAEGCGLNLPLDGFDVSVLPDEPAELRDVRPEIKLSRHWKLTHLEPEDGVIGAVAADASCSTLRGFKLTSYGIFGNSVTKL